MQPIDLSRPLSKYTTGWVALDKKKRIVAYGRTFNSVVKKTKENKDVLLVPASKNYFGFVTFVNG